MSSWALATMSNANPPKVTSRVVLLLVCGSCCGLDCDCPLVSALTRSPETALLLLSVVTGATLVVGCASDASGVWTGEFATPCEVVGLPRTFIIRNGGWLDSR